ncbi:hypothetical protein MGAS11027_0386 [Streptococcus pyogenes]|nr:hypothetical protein MGAS11027_0386 [Streptococcus pyogenes]ANC25072.1 hypothetical protein MGAS23530_0381 [Streptococcus pyogenes]ANC26673.1 hypothetical protein MGAS27061_0389 [Streptococcus pyogenes]
MGKLTFFHILYQSAVRYLNVLNSPFSSSSITFFSVINKKSTKKHQKSLPTAIREALSSKSTNRQDRNFGQPVCPYQG